MPTSTQTSSVPADSKEGRVLLRLLGQVSHLREVMGALNANLLQLNETLSNVAEVPNQPQRAVIVPPIDSLRRPTDEIRN